MEALEQNKIVNITKFSGYECYINPKYITKIYKTIIDDYYNIVVLNSNICLYEVKTKQQLNEFLDYICSR